VFNKKGNITFDWGDEEDYLVLLIPKNGSDPLPGKWSYPE
jgi:hypothetical protein